jgi:hypothetical protein
VELMDDLKQMIEDRLADEPRATRVLITLTEKCCETKGTNCRVCDGRGYVMDAANLTGKLR